VILKGARKALHKHDANAEHFLRGHDSLEGLGVTQVPSLKSLSPKMHAQVEVSVVIPFGGVIMYFYILLVSYSNI